MFAKVEGEEDADEQEPEESETQPMDVALDEEIHAATSHLPRSNDSEKPSQSDLAARKLIKTLFDQSHLSPFSQSVRPVFWDHASALSLYPLPTALVLADAESPAFCVSYEGCHVLNPGRLVDDNGGTGRRGGMGRWIEYDILDAKGIVREIRF
jgi:DNA polymerase epsilon subunit 2